MYGVDVDADGDESDGSNSESVAQPAASTSSASHVHIMQQVAGSIYQGLATERQAVQPSLAQRHARARSKRSEIAMLRVASQLTMRRP